MKVVVLGATGNVGFAVTAALTADDAVDEVVGVARRVPEDDGDGSGSGVRWVAADITTDDLQPVLAGADAVVHLAWLIQPSRSPQRLWRVNVDGTARVLDAVAEAGVSALVYASSVGAYSPGPEDGHAVGESWPTHGIATSEYSRQKAYVERMLDAFEVAHLDTRLVRLRPGLIFQGAAASEQARLFLGPLVPRSLLRPGVLPLFPDLVDVRFQAVHATDVADAYRRAVLGDARGAFNVAAEPVLSTRDVAAVLGARTVPVPVGLARAAAASTWHLRLHPVSPGWVDLAVRCPVLDTGRARRELGWSPVHDARDTIREVLEGMADGQGGPTPTLASDAGVADRAQQLASGQGERTTTDGPAQVPERRR